jgi:hypothetical protein
VDSPQQRQQPNVGSGLLQPQYDPETQSERDDRETERERRRWDEDRPPHYEAR